MANIGLTFLKSVELCVKYFSGTIEVRWMRKVAYLLLPGEVDLRAGYGGGDADQVLVAEEGEALVLF